MSYILFTADFDENTSSVKRYDTLDALADDTDSFCCECGRKTVWFEELLKDGYRKDEWHEYHLIEVSDNE